MMKARKYVVKKHFQGIPKRDDFAIEEYVLPPLQDGDILVKVEWVSVDPYLRVLNAGRCLPYDQFSYQVGLVLQSMDPNYPIGSRIFSHKGWCDYMVINPNMIKDPADIVYKLPDMQGLPNSLGVGAVGMPGVTAYLGLVEICQPRAGETVVVTGAAGAVGSLVGQIAKIKGCTVIGFAGSDEKVQWLETELGFDKAYNYKTASVKDVLKEAAPNGIDCYFDNVGGEISSIIINAMNANGRVACCGSISSYNSDPEQMPKATLIQPALVFKQIKVEGFLVWRWAGERWQEALLQLILWIKNHQLKVREHVTEGFDNIYDAFVGMLAGDNLGKAVVKL